MIIPYDDESLYLELSVVLTKTELEFLYGHRKYPDCKFLGFVKIDDRRKKKDDSSTYGLVIANPARLLMVMGIGFHIVIYPDDRQALLSGDLVIMVGSSGITTLHTKDGKVHNPNVYKREQ